MRAAASSVILGILAAEGAFATDVLVGGENWRFKTDLDLKSGGGDFVAHHSSSAVTTQWRLNKNFSLDLNIGTVTSSLEDASSGISYGPGDGFYLLAGFEVAQELDTGGGLMLDGSYSIGRADWSGNEYNHDRTRFFVGYLFGKGDRSRLYTGVSYNTYTAEHVAVTTTSYENDTVWNVVAGIRARSETFVGTAELSGIGEWGFRLGLSFGF